MTDLRLLGYCGSNANACRLGHGRELISRAYFRNRTGAGTSHPNVSPVKDHAERATAHGKGTHHVAAARFQFGDSVTTVVRDPEAATRKGQPARSIAPFDLINHASVAPHLHYRFTAQL